MSCALLVCTPSSHASVPAAQASLPRHRGGIAARPALPGSPAGAACALQPGAATPPRAVRAAREGDLENVFHAGALDPLTAALLTLEDARAMTEELLAAHADRLPERLREG